MSDNLDKFQNEVNGEIDRRKLDKLIQEGAFTLDDLLNAPIIMVCSRCSLRQNYNNEVCEKCGEIL